MWASASASQACDVVEARGERPGLVDRSTIDQTPAGASDRRRRAGARLDHSRLRPKAHIRTPSTAKDSNHGVTIQNDADEAFPSNPDNPITSRPMAAIFQHNAPRNWRRRACDRSVKISLV